MWCDVSCGLTVDLVSVCVGVSVCVCFFCVHEVTSVTSVLVSFSCADVVGSAAICWLNDNCWFTTAVLLESDVLSFVQLCHRLC